MLSNIIPVEWRPSGVEDFAANAALPLPQSLRDLAATGFSSPLSVSRHTGDGAIPLRIGLLYSDAGLLFMEAPVRYLPEKDAVLIARSPLEELYRDFRSAGTQELVKPQLLRGGVGDLLPLRRLDAAVCQALGVPDESFLWTWGTSSGLSRNRSLSDSSLGLPDALVFHDDSMPDNLTLTLEAATACNFRCTFCYGRHIDQGILKWDDFLGLLDRLPGLQAIEFTGEGEPLMNKRILEMLAECKRRHLWVHLTTNGSLLDRGFVAQIADLGVESLAISLESLRPERFARLRQGGTLEVVLDALRMAHRVRRERHSGLQLRLWITLLKETLDELDAFDSLAKELELDGVEFQLLNPLSAYTRFYDDFLLSNMLTVDQLKSAIDARPPSLAIRQSLENLIKVYDGRRCDIFMSAAMVYWQGEVTPCRLLKVPQHPSVGNIVNKGYLEIWNNPTFRRFRFALQHGIILRSCENCPFVAGA
jgi:MoaA/NifB/PqqE/SkfB family radical SAM enzyme